MFKKSRRLNLVLLFLAVAALLVISFVFIFEIGTRAARVAEDLLQRQSTVQRLAAVVTTASDAETGQRGYLLTGDEKYLAPYTNALSAMPVRMAALRKAAAESLVSAHDVDKIDQLVSAKFSELAETVDLKRQHRDPEALAIVKAGQGKQLMDEVRNACDQIVITQQAQINADLGETIRDGKIRSLLYFGGLVVNLAFLGWVCWRIFAEMGARDAAAKAIDEQREYLDVTLASIGDGVIVTDANGAVTFLNEVAQQLSGWSQREAKGRPCAEIFHIVNETTRTIQENPVDKVLMTGRIVGLANHTVLIRRDGSEIPIDDSGAPIRNKDGTIAGVVLVFRDFSDQKKSAEAMTTVKNELEKANQAKDEFLAALSHELRAPLTPIIATLNRWQAQKRLDKEMLAELTMLQRNAALEARLVDDLLDIARITQRSDILPLVLGSLRVLMIEDHEDTAIVMARMLKDMGHNVVSANSVASAVDALTREKFDLIVSDIGLPDGNGVSLIHAVRSFCHAPAIAMTGYGMREDVERCLNAGFNKHVTKPVTFETLQQIIAEVCGNQNDKINQPSST